MNIDWSDKEQVLVIEDDYVHVSLSWGNVSPLSLSSEKLRNDRDVVMAAIEKDEEALAHTLRTRFATISILCGTLLMTTRMLSRMRWACLMILKSCRPFWKMVIWRCPGHLGDKLKDDSDFMLGLTSDFVTLASARLKDDLDFVAEQSIIGATIQPCLAPALA